MSKIWANKNNTSQLKIPTKQLKANLAIISHTKLNVFYLIDVTKQSHVSLTPVRSESPPPSQL